MIDTKTKINLYKENMKVADSGFTGKIEFKDVWFRYPSRKADWIFKGLNLTLNPK